MQVLLQTDDHLVQQTHKVQTNQRTCKTVLQTEQVKESRYFLEENSSD